jgi:hypothetical protein
MSKTNFRSFHDQTDLTQTVPLGLQPLLCDRQVPFPNIDRHIIQKAAQTPGQAYLLCSSGNLPGNLAKVNRAAFINTNHPPNKVADPGYSGFRLQFANLVHPSIIEAVDRHWATPGIKWFRQTNFIGQSVPVNSSFFKLSGS